MKKIILIVTFLFATPIFADCAWSAMDFFPKEVNIGLNSLFLIQGYGESQKTIDSFKTRKVFLQDENGEHTELILVEILTGQKNLKQALFKPSHPLQANTQYFIVYENATTIELAEIKQWNPTTKTREPVIWQTSEKTAVTWIDPQIKISFERNKVEHFGCGSAVNAFFNIAANKSDEIWYKTEVFEVATHTKTTFYLMEEAGKLAVGHGMCAGGFKYSRSGKYKIRFTPMNTDGASIKTTDWIAIDTPQLSDKWAFPAPKAKANSTKAKKTVTSKKTGTR